MAEHETEDPIIAQLKEMNRHLLWIERGVQFLVLAVLAAVALVAFS